MPERGQIFTLAGWELYGQQPHGPANFKRAGVFLVFRQQALCPKVDSKSCRLVHPSDMPDQSRAVAGSVPRVLPALAGDTSEPEPRGACPRHLSLIVTHKLVRVPPAKFFLRISSGKGLWQCTLQSPHPYTKITHPEVDHFTTLTPSLHYTNLT